MTTRHDSVYQNKLTAVNDDNGPTSIALGGPRVLAWGLYCVEQYVLYVLAKFFRWLIWIQFKWRDCAKGYDSSIYFRLSKTLCPSLLMLPSSLKDIASLLDVLEALCSFTICNTNCIYASGIIGGVFVSIIKRARHCPFNLEQFHDSGSISEELEPCQH